ncbi:hypothetical protein CEXT_619511 [Caerostris extrusa]|uniref:Uncharacterized protein n=1 Tax=Caerostris extrusa TaxID=172846 RepID=A0AAV4N874_CAEEX|nr:hypothetical protein CEXT_619511 [Caerostris extrusa]
MFLAACGMLFDTIGIVNLFSTRIKLFQKIWEKGISWGQSKNIALKRLNSLWIRLSTDAECLSLYKMFWNEYRKLEDIKEVEEEKEPYMAYYATQSVDFGRDSAPTHSDFAESGNEAS